MQVGEMFIGVDVAKATLSICSHGIPGHRDLPNEAAAIRAWLAQLPRRAAIAVESTGRYHQTVVRLATGAGHRVFVLNARDVYFYARALGARGKTDRTDAQVIARYLAEHHGELKQWVPATADQERLQQLLRRRAGLTSKRTSLRQMLDDVPVPALKRGVRNLEREFDAVLQIIDREVDALIAADARLSQGRAALRTITGIGPQGSALLTALLSRFNFANGDAVVAYSGLDPRPNDSGAKTGRRRLSKRGPPELRRQLYMAAFSAAHSKAWGPLYKSLRAKGFKTTEAFVILGRKLLRVAWAVWNTGKAFDPSRHALPAACQKL